MKLKLLFFAIIILAFLAQPFGQAFAAENRSVVNALSDDAPLIIAVSDVSKAREDLKQTSLGQLLQHPSVQSFREHGLRKLNDKLLEIHEAYGFRLSDAWNLFPGEAAAGLMLVPNEDSPSGAAKISPS